ncbi:hypothetical protein INT47_006585, partial [Mucor saturninus]
RNTFHKQDMPFGLKVPSKNTLISSGVAGGFAGLVYSSNKYAQDARTRLAQRVSFLADRPCGVHEMPRKVTVYITAPPDDGLEKSRTWFREYVKEIKEAKSPNQIEASVMKEIIQSRREPAEASSNTESADHGPLEIKSNTGFTSPVDNMNNKKKSEVVYDGILAIGRNTYREVLSALGRGCDTILTVFVEVRLLKARNLGNVKSHIIQELDHFSLPLEFSHIMDIPRMNIIRWLSVSIIPKY